MVLRGIIRTQLQFLRLQGRYVTWNHVYYQALCSIHLLRNAEFEIVNDTIYIFCDALNTTRPSGQRCVLG